MEKEIDYEKLERQYHEANAEIDAYELAILKLVEPKLFTPVQALLSGMKGAVEDAAILLYRMRQFDKEQKSDS